jgi:molecular chaperone GrpE
VENEKNREGLTMIYKKLLRVLGNYGLKSIDALGKKFDPNCHEVLCKEICNEENDLILEEYQKGYQLKSKVIRPSKVKIAEKGTGEIGDSYA